MGEQEEQRYLCRLKAVGCWSRVSSVPPVKAEMRRMRLTLLLRDKAQQLEYQADSEAVASIQC